MAVNYRDNTPFEGDNHTVGELAEDIRTKMYGVDVRESIAQAVEKMENWTKGNNVGEIIATPTKVFDDLEALQSAYPNGADGVMVTVDNGHKYFWNNNQWTDGGAYQAPVGDAINLTQTLHDRLVYESELQNKIWQRKNALNMQSGAWLNSSGHIETYSGWGFTPDYIPVRPSTDYIFAAYDSDTNPTVVGISSVYVSLYRLDKSYIGQVNTSVSSGGVFNTAEASYIRISMSLNTYSDALFPSLFKGNQLPETIDDDIYSNFYEVGYKHLANAMADFSLVPITSVFKMENLPLQIYDDALIEGQIQTDQTKVFLYDTFSGLITRNNAKNGYKIPENSSTRTLEFNAVTGKSPESYWRYPVELHKKSTKIYLNEVSRTSGNGKTANVLIIGDSLTNFNHYVNRVGELSEGDGLTINLLGTRGDTFKHEGRGGWRARDYTGVETFNTYTNPFLFNGNFDFSAYMNAQNYSDVDIVFINLGTNDVARNDILSDRNFTQDFAAYNTMISSIREFNPNVKIVLGSTIEPARFANENVHIKTRRQIWNRLMMDFCHEKNCTFLPYWLAVDPINDFTYEEVAVDDYNSKVIEKVADNTHPAISGYTKMGDLTFAAIKKIASDM